MKRIFFIILSCICLTGGALGQQPIVIKEQGSFAVGGTVITNPGTFDPYTRTPEGQTLHGDHAYVFYQLPDNARKLPLVFWHGTGQFSKTWETTPDGREGFQNIFLRRGFGVYLIDQPRRGNAGRGTVGTTITPTPDEQEWFGTFRVGVWPEFFEGVQFDKDPETLNQYFRQMTPNTGPFDLDVFSDAGSALFDRIGAGILVTHSHAGGLGWMTAMKNENVKAIVSYEPGSNFVFPEGEVPEPIPSSAGALEANPVPMADFMKLTKIPIVIYYGDFIPEQPSDNPGTDGWRVRLEMARIWVATVNKYGGDATIIHLPEVGIRGNTHFPFSDLNNIEIADLLSDWLKAKGLDRELPKTTVNHNNMVRLSRIIVDPERLDEYNAYLKEEIEASMTLEPGVLTLYAVAEKELPNRITILEIYADEQAYRSHIQTPHFIKYKEGTLDMVQSLELIDATPLIPGLKIK